MVPALLGRKIGMTQVYDDQGVLHPVTVVRAGPCRFSGTWPLRVELGDRDRVDFVRVVWPDGRVTAHGPYDADRDIVIRETP